MVGCLSFFFPSPSLKSEKNIVYSIIIIISGTYIISSGSGYDINSFFDVRLNLFSLHRNYVSVSKYKHLFISLFNDAFSVTQAM
jgi:hypothetical protein